jgi:hypothetical protein
VNCMVKHERSGGSLESESCQGRQLVVIHPWEGKLHPSSSTSQGELQSNPYEFKLPARDKNPEQLLAARNAATPSLAQEAAAEHRNWCWLQAVP